ncbi:MULTISPECIES: efflux RND transporter permease subunit [Pseudorhizobium]|jgi:multidrug efflux pump|uniref:Efflux pump membrane transporter n=1 Tax=Pseudorhizobium pelagicum TaxID=1509405 RepID=A0A922NW80_9HYPH|nr:MULTISPECIES: efflux RND transporter permease subunit [Pseudorhizobium]MBA4785988.1 multidrug efflux RND transporter permease subunit [Hyphomicrobiales bacterium]MBU1314856.1 multidrug efflux RND transporter permease subunit [Alphaproteobacteria bacterium]KEQ02268.1 multidrug transporter [Pseudorhizobium pelagicum]KEQ02327.1 multidrug transporter [Pseudorhizobium pelagicum]MBU1550354.1 multidrug efflux RND transporter permease subunit [Alphaproteobacteria bacterium]|tara:strand:+ start:2065 stop:5175 length:3111 start_codon:yes stop_codon:yes gene_type:complete
MAKFFIRRPVFAWVIAIVIMLGGALAISTLSISQYPDIAPTTVRIAAGYNGASAETVEKSVTSIIEDGMTGLDDLTYMTSASSTGSATVTLTFGNTVDPEIAQVQVQNKLQLVQSQLPDVVQQAGISVTRSTSSILMVGALVSTDSTRSSVDLGDVFTTSIEDQIKRLEGVGSIDIFGTGYAMRIWLDPLKLQKYQLTPSDVTSAIQAQNTQVSVGSLGGQPVVEGQQLTVTMTAQSQLRTVDDFEAIILKVEPDGATVRLSDVAQVEIGQESYGSSSRQNGLPSTGFAVNLATGANALDTAARVKAALADIGPTLPEGVEITYPYDTTPFVQLSIEKVVHTLIEAIILVFVVLLIFLQNLRATIIPMIAVPVVLLGTFGILAISGYSINTLTMFAMVLAIGLLVDDAIVVVENVERIMDEEGLSPLEATEKSMDEITGAIIGIALVLTAVFIPMAFFGGSTGIIYRQFSITIVSAMLLSALVAIVLTPALCATMLKPIDHHKKGRGIGAWFNRGFDRTTGGYVGSVGYLLKRPFRVMLMFALVVAGCAWMFTRLPSSFLPQEDQGVLLTIIQTPAGSTTARTDAVVKQVEAYFMENEKENVETVFGVLGFSFGGSGQNNAIVFTKLKDFEERTGPGQSAAEIVQRAGGYFFTLRDAQVFPLLPPAIQGLGTSSGFSMYLVDSGGNGNDALTAASQQLIQTASANANISSLRSNSLRSETQLKILLDQEKLGAMGVDLTAVNTMLTTIFAGRDVNDFTLNNELKPVYVQGDSEYRMQPDDLNFWYARNSEGEMVPFSAFSRVEWESGTPQLARFNGTSAISLEGAAGPGVSTGEAMNEMERLTAELPGGYSVAWQGISYQERLSGSQAPALYALSVLIVFLCLAALYESWSIPFSVILAVPVGVLGALAAAQFFGQSNDVYFKVGLLTTIGLAAKNAILIVEFAKDRMVNGKGVVEATLEAARLRLRPIIMTSLAFILGVVPLAIATGAGSAAQNAIGIGVLGGMLSATLLGIFFVPSFFVVVRRLSKREKREKTA